MRKHIEKFCSTGNHKTSTTMLYTIGLVKYINKYHDKINQFSQRAFYKSRKTNTYLRKTYTLF